MSNLGIIFGFKASTGPTSNNGTIATKNVLSNNNLSSTGPENNNEASDSFTTYTNAYWGVQLSHPSTWKILESTDTENTGEIVKFVPPGEENSLVYRVYFAIYDFKSNKKDDLSDISQDSINNYRNDKTFKNFKILDQSIISDKLGGYPAYSFTASYKEDGVPYKILDMGMKIGTNEYDILFLAEVDKFDKYYPLAKKIIDSMTLI